MNTIRRLLALVLTLSVIMGIISCLAETVDDPNTSEHCAYGRFYHSYDEAYGFCLNCGSFIPDQIKAEYEQAYMAMTCVQNTLISPRSMEVERALFKGDESKFKNTTYIEYYYTNECGAEIKDKAIIILDSYHYSIKTEKGDPFDFSLTLRELKETGHKLSKFHLFLCNQKLQSSTSDLVFLKPIK